ncbi:MAG TPA: TadE family protein [Pyrinomonadaceae bacterium]|nr:TadE family protein [Pyrinomonadaceae bacterium]
MSFYTRLMKSINRFVRRENGTHMVEAAIVLPFMLVMLGGLAEFGRYFYTYSALTNAVRAGARHACKWRRNDSWTFPETSTMVVYGDFSDTSKGPIVPGLSTSNVIVQANGPSVNAIDSVTVKIVNYKYQPLFDLGKMTGIQSLSLNIDMNASATMHQLFNGPVAN